jgi:hypothetical protein
LWSYARRYLLLSYYPAFEETLSTDQGHGGGIACTAEVDTLKAEEEDPHTILMGQLKFKMYWET